MKILSTSYNKKYCAFIVDYMIMTSYLAIATFLHVLQRQQRAVRLYTDSFFKNTV